jgi:hypothetical protein
MCVNNCIKFNELGFDAGKPDGFSGPKTRNATRDYQRANNLLYNDFIVNIYIQLDWEQVFTTC